MDNLDTWPTKREVMERFNLSERTVERKIRNGELRKALRSVPGRKPLPILHPDDVTKLEAVTLKPIPIEKAVEKKEPRHSDNGNLTALLAALLAARPQPKLYLSVKEAAQFSGLPQTYLREKIKAGILPAVKIGGWRIRRRDLNRFDAVTSTLTP